MNKSFGKLKEEAVYIRRGTSTDIAKPDEIARMGVEANVEQAPKLDLIARVVNSHGLAIILAIRNEEGAGSAKAPRLSVKLKGPFSEGMYGLDGNGNLGLPRRPQGFDSGYLTYGGDTGTIIPAGITHDVTLLEYRGRTDAVPERVDIEFELSAEGVAPSRKVLILKIA